MLVMRHGETTWNVAGRWQGWIDIELSAEGEAQAHARGADLVARGFEFGAIVSSDLQRAARTAEIIAFHFGRADVIQDAALRERAGGKFEGLDAAAIDAGWPGFRDRWRAGLEDAPPGGESDADVWRRVAPVFERLAIFDSGPVLLVTHGGVARIIGDRAATPSRSVMANVGGRWFSWEHGTLVAGRELDPLPDTDRTQAAIE